jgi:hypothetical protein
MLTGKRIVLEKNRDKRREKCLVKTFLSREKIK